MNEPTNPLFLDTRERCAKCDTILETYLGDTRPCPFGCDDRSAA